MFFSLFGCARRFMGRTVKTFVGRKLRADFNDDDVKSCKVNEFALLIQSSSPILQNEEEKSV